MKITRQIVADKIADYLHGKVSQTELVDWAERAMMDADFDETDMDVLSDIIGRLGLADVAEFGLRWQDCEEFLRRLGYKAKVIVSADDHRLRITYPSTIRTRHFRCFPPQRSARENFRSSIRRWTNPPWRTISRFNDFTPLARLQPSRRYPFGVLFRPHAF